VRMSRRPGRQPLPVRPLLRPRRVALPARRPLRRSRQPGPSATAGGTGFTPGHPAPRTSTSAALKRRRRRLAACGVGGICINLPGSFSGRNCCETFRLPGVLGSGAGSGDGGGGILGSGLSTVELVAISGASAIILLLALMVFLCVSCCCLRRRQRRGRCVNGAANGKLAQQQAAAATTTEALGDPLGALLRWSPLASGETRIVPQRELDCVLSQRTSANLRLLREADAGLAASVSGGRRRRSSFLLLAGFNVFSGSGGCCCSRGSCIGRHADSLLDAE
uniref:Membrane protein FAM159A n=1 Tax=Macrostomum lignano TaxID=282301 RepID=A0A1I8F6R1_9PLAT